ncbi:MAG: Holliday junction resolvase RuvX [Myxococcales bacterium]|nr:Holliday junction resolvase RuvX [Polyangiaceae bacterium]MDW8250278.1 Holliday junction resolvase RuvX [Myxococcales bacterium]
MRVAALDVGKARIGVAVSDELGLLAHPRPFVPARNREAALHAIKLLQREEGIERFLVGLPRRLGGEAGSIAAEVIRFAQEVSNLTGCEVELVDERWSTVQASRALRAGGLSSKEQRGRVDSAAAAVLLQAWLDAPGRRGT